MIRETLVLLSILITSLSSIAQDLVRFQSIGREDGLSHESVSCFLEDRTGFIWIGTYYGLNRYDGQFIKTFYADESGLANSSIASLYEDSKGIIWIGTISGLSKYDPTTGIFQQVGADLPIDEVKAIIEDENGNIWISSWVSGVFMINPEGGVSHLKEELPQDAQMIDLEIMKCLPGYLWISSSRGLVKYDIEARSYVRYKNDPKDENTVASSSINGLLADEDFLWLSTNGVGLDKFHPKTETFTHFKNNRYDPKSIQGTEVGNIIKDHHGDLWLTMYGDGLARLVDEEAGEFQHFIRDSNDPFSLRNNNLVPLFQDSKNRIWIGTRGSGVALYDPEFMKFDTWRMDLIRPFALSSNNIAYIHIDSKNDLWIGYRSGGLDHFIRNEKGDIVEKDRINLSSSAYDSTFDKDKLSVLFIEEYAMDIFLFGLRGYGFQLYDAKLRKVRDYINVPGDLDKVEEGSGYGWLRDKKGRLHLISQEGYFIYDEKKKSLSQDLIPPEMQDVHFNAILEDRKGEIWLASERVGLFRLDITKQVWKQYSVQGPSVSGIANKKVLCLHEDKQGAIWMGFWGSGMDRIDPVEETFEHFTTAEGLPNNVVYSIQETENGNLWVSTNYGLARYNPSTREFLNFDVRDGLQGEEFNSRVGLYNEKDGEMLFGGVNGLNRFYPADLNIESAAGDLHLTGMEYSSRGGQGYSYQGSAKQPITLGPADHSLVFNLSTVNADFYQPRNIQYKLEPLDDEWINEEAVSQVKFAELSPGHYIFKARSTPDFKTFSNEVFQPITVLAPIHKRWWAYLTYGILTVAAFYLIYRNRVKQLLKYQQLRRKISGDLHDDVGTTLTGLVFQSEVLAFKEKGVKKQEFQKINQLAREAMESMRDVVWAIDSSKDKYENLVDRMRDFAVRQLAPKDILLNFQVEGIQEGTPLDPVSRQNYFLFFKEAISNIVKHSSASEVHVLFKKTSREVTLSVKDNGMERTHKKTDGSGLSNMKMRAQNLGGELEISNSDGFSVKLTV